MKASVLVVAAMLVAAAPLVHAAGNDGTPGPVIDMHVHAWPLEAPPGAPVCPGSQGVTMPVADPRAPFDFSAFPGCEKPLLAPSGDQALQDQSIAELRRHNVRRAVLDGTPERVAQWRQAAPGLFLPAVAFGKKKELSTDEMRRLHREGRLQAFAEVAMQYRGLRADDPRYEPYFALAEELDVPVGIHLGEGPPGAARFPGYADYRASATSPFQLEEVLRRHPKLRVYVMHYGSPLVDEMIAMMYTHPGLYVDVGCNDWQFPRAQFHDALRRMVEAGFGKRILFGSDQMYWPGAIGEAIAAIEDAPFLDAAQKRDILYHNAARFLRLGEAEIAADHRRLAQ
ncbi:amidohydrolase family protein [Pseudoxanthomonas daejeonensis]|uniref:Metal-dependent hydrolase n=1 Tax=Pseudoxanthomonas daejeonensis TaxID=266062 RepID=A0ABQ6Z8J8_9GAMM|nr:amidohydrolase family protein [Pseudoxanthomonas daejeonensis]KAF1695355.1 metal-dependent hydrolase [Pseudoxanthomonas daejeonensis]